MEQHKGKGGLWDCGKKERGILQWNSRKGRGISQQNLRETRICGTAKRERGNFTVEQQKGKRDFSGTAGREEIFQRNTISERGN